MARFGSTHLHKCVMMYTLALLRRDHDGPWINASPPSCFDNSHMSVRSPVSSGQLVRSVLNKNRSREETLASCAGKLCRADIRNQPRPGTAVRGCMHIIPAIPIKSE